MCPDCCQLTCLNLSNNRIHKLDELAELVTKVPNLKTLNLSHNEVKMTAVSVENNKLPLAWIIFKSSSHHLVYLWLSSWSRTGSWTKWKAWSWWSCGWTGTLCVTTSRIRHHTSGQSVILWGEWRGHSDVTVSLQVGVPRSLSYMTACRAVLQKNVNRVCVRERCLYNN